MKKKRVVLLVIGILVIIAVGIGMKLSSDLAKYRKQVEAINITGVELTKVKDGTYDGSYETLLVSADVKVIVKDHQITNIDLVRHNHGKGASAEIIPQKIMGAQSLEVDVVTGATNSSKVILKAVENALKKGLIN